MNHNAGIGAKPTVDPFHVTGPPVGPQPEARPNYEFLAMIPRLSPGLENRLLVF